MSPVLALSWGGFVVATCGAFALVMILLGLAFFARDEVVNVEDPEDRWAREAREVRR